MSQQEVLTAAHCTSGHSVDTVQVTVYNVSDDLNLYVQNIWIWKMLLLEPSLYC